MRPSASENPLSLVRKMSALDNLPPPEFGRFYGLPIANLTLYVAVLRLINSFILPYSTLLLRTLFTNRCKCCTVVQNKQIYFLIKSK